MSKLEILIYPDPILRKRCAEVAAVDNSIRQLLDDMAETMYQASGIGLAAAQVGSPHRVIVVDVGDDLETGQAAKLYKLVNPTIVDASGSVRGEEGCLSIPGIRETIRRHAQVRVHALDEQGAEVEISAQGMLAVCLQHEIDHLNGVLFIDHLSMIKRELLKKKLTRIPSTADE